MKLLYSILRGIFAIIGVLTVAFIFWLRFADISIMIKEGDIALYEDRLESLRTSGAYRQDSVDFKIRVVQDSAKAKEIRDYFHLDTLYSSKASSWEKALAIASFVARNIPHANQEVQPEHKSAIALWEYTRKVEPAFNCRLHSILTFELMLAAGLTTKFVTCMPEDRNDPDCHVVNEVWLPEKGKWAMIDSDMGGNYASDENGTPLSLSEMREYYISGKQMLMHPGFGEGTDELSRYYAYMAKNTYWFMCWDVLTYGIEDYQSEYADSSRCVYLSPPNFKTFNTWDNSIVTTNAKLFWSKIEP